MAVAAPGGVSAPWMRVLAHLDPAGCLLTTFAAPPLAQYLAHVQLCEVRSWCGLAAVLTAPGCVACGKPTPYLFSAPRTPLARRCPGCRGRTSAHGPSSGTALRLVNCALFGARPAVARVGSEAALGAALASAAHGDTIEVQGVIGSNRGHGWGSHSYGPDSCCVRLRGVGSGSGLHVRNNCVYLGVDAMLENLHLTSGRSWGEDDVIVGEIGIMSGFWGAGLICVMKDCEVVGWQGTCFIAGGPGGLTSGPYHTAAIRCTLTAPYHGCFFCLQPASITRFLECSFSPGENSQSPDGRVTSAMLVMEGDHEQAMTLLRRRNRFPSAADVEIESVNDAPFAGAPRSTFLLS